ncbi:MAG: ABC transporter substrate binding protein, partial [Bacteroidales bacterium]
MKKMIKNLWLIVLLILLASAILLLSDMEQRRSYAGQPRQEYPQIAIMQITSTPLLDNHINGVIDRLDASGMVAADRSNIRRFNPQGDMGTANTIAREIVNGPCEMVITSSTVALQIFAKANQDKKKHHVFGAVTDPYGTGVGITG